MPAGPGDEEDVPFCGGTTSNDRAGGEWPRPFFTHETSMRTTITIQVTHGDRQALDGLLEVLRRGGLLPEVWSLLVSFRPLLTRIKVADEAEVGRQLDAAVDALLVRRRAGLLDPPDGE